MPQHIRLVFEREKKSIFVTGLPFHGSRMLWNDPQINASLNRDGTRYVHVRPQGDRDMFIEFLHHGHVEIRLIARERLEYDLWLQPH